MLAVLAQMTHREDMGNGGAWWAWLVGAVVLVILVGLIVFAMVRMMTTTSPSNGRTGASERQSAEAVLAERLARGEIDEEEYRRRRDALRS